MLNDGSLDGKVALITGAAGDIGSATARLLIARGAHVFAIDRNDLGPLADELGHLRLTCVEGDVTDEHAVNAFVRSAISVWGRVDAFVNNAGIEGAMRTIPDLSLADFSRVLTVNVNSVFLGMKHIIPVMREAGGGTIINVASTAGLAATPKACAYIASKHAVIGLTRAAASEWASSGIRINCVAPGPVQGRMMRSIIDGLDTVGDLVRARIPAGQFATPAQVASVIAFLVSDDSQHMHGAVIPVDGGRTAV